MDDYFDDCLAVFFSDGSQAMLDKLSARGLYRHSVCAFVGNGARTAGVSDASYDVATMAGGFVRGHCPVDALDEFARVLRKERRENQLG